MYHYLFGPVPSRRLGISLGVDQVTHKVCSLDCVYCECGETTELTLERKSYVERDAVLSELKHYFENHPDPDYITFSGSGEPTLNVHIGEVIRFIKDAKPGISVAVLTNGTLLDRSDVRKDLLNADLVMPSLDAANVRSFRKINRPHGDLDVLRHIQGLEVFVREYREFQGQRGLNGGKVALEIVVLPGINDFPEDLDALTDACARIAPDVIQLNTLDRPGVVDTLRPATAEHLENIRTRFKKSIKGLDVEIIASAPDRTSIASYREDMSDAIMETLRRRPCTVKDLAIVLGSHVNEINKYISQLEQVGEIVSKRQERGLFYHCAKS